MKSQEVFFTADQHFNHGGKSGHDGIIQYCNRPFEDVKEMNEELILRWNAKVPPGGLVYHLGDFAWGERKGFGTVGLPEILDKLNGNIFLIIGSHDKPMLEVFRRGRSKITKCSPLHTIHLDGEWVTLCHYCMRVWSRSHYNSWHLFGHSHNRLKPEGKSLDVGVDGHNFYPWSWPEIKEYMKDRPHNFNYVGNTYSGRGL